MSLAERTDVDQVARKAKRVASPLIERLARVGYAAKSVLYLAVAGFVALTASGKRQHADETDTEGVLFYLDEGPLGSIVLVLLSIGLAGHALWRFIQGILDPEDKAHGVIGWLRRISYLVRGTLHGALVVTAVQLLLDEAGRKEGVKDWSAEIMHRAPPFGAWLVGMIGLAVIAYALDSLHKVWTRRLRKELDLSGLARPWRISAMTLCRVGVTARAFLFIASGGFIVLAAFRGDPTHAKGFGEALRALQAWEHGAVTLWVFAVGIVAYAFQEALKALRRDITPI